MTPCYKLGTGALQQIENVIKKVLDEKKKIKAKSNPGFADPRIMEALGLIDAIIENPPRKKEIIERLIEIGDLLSAVVNSAEGK